MYYWYYATQLFHHLEGISWNKWNSHSRPAVATNLERQGRRELVTAVGHDTDRGAPRRPAVCHLPEFMLEVYYRHLPLYSTNADWKSSSNEVSCSCVGSALADAVSASLRPLKRTLRLKRTLLSHPIPLSRHAVAQRRAVLLLDFVQVGHPQLAMLIEILHVRTHLFERQQRVKADDARVHRLRDVVDRDRASAESAMAVMRSSFRSWLTRISSIRL